MKWKSSYTSVPLWVNVLHFWIQFVDYHIVSPVSSRLTYWQCDLINKYCTCDKCKARAENAARWAAKETVNKRASD